MKALAPAVIARLAWAGPCLALPGRGLSVDSVWTAPVSGPSTLLVLAERAGGE